MSRRPLLTVEAGLQICLWTLLVRALPFRKVAAFHRAPVRIRHGAARADMDGLAMAVRGAIRSASARLPYQPTCLMQSLAAAAMFRMRAHPYQLHLGMDRELTGPFQAHAWVECAGMIVAGEADVGRYQVMLSWPEGRA